MQNNNYVCTNMAAELFSLNSDIFIATRSDLIDLESSMSSLEIEYAKPQQQQEQQQQQQHQPPHDEIDTKNNQNISSPRIISFIHESTDIIHSPSSSSTANMMEHSTESTIPFRINWRRSLRSSNYYNEYDSDNHDSKSNSNQSLHRVNRRTILKPKKKTFKIGNTESELKKIYLNQKLTSLRSTCLETIVEEDLTNLNEVDHDGGDELVTFIGVRKLKRSLSCSSGATKNKSILQRRKKRIKAAFGDQKFKSKKIPMHMFIDKLKSMHNTTEDEMELRMNGTISDNKTLIHCGNRNEVIGEHIQFRTFGESKSDPECFSTD